MEKEILDKHQMKFPKEFVLNHPELIIKNQKIAKRFFSKIQFPEDRENNCWIWTGKPSNNGYGRFTLPDYVSKKYLINPKSRLHDHKPHDTHRLMYKIAYGEILKSDDCICHTCDNRLCVNPFHMWKGTRSENTLDMHQKGRFKHVPRPKKLKKYQVILIQCFLSLGQKVKTLAEHFNVSKSTISKIKNGVY